MAKELKSTPEELAYGKIYSKGYGAAERKFKDTIAELESSLALSELRATNTAQALRDHFARQMATNEEKCLAARKQIYHTGVMLGTLLGAGLVAVVYLLSRWSIGG